MNKETLERLPDLVRRLVDDYLAERRENQKLIAALQAKDDAMSVLFKRLADNDIDFADLIP